LPPGDAWSFPTLDVLRKNGAPWRQVLINGGWMPLPEPGAGLTSRWLLAEAGDSPDDPIPVGIETDRGLRVGALRETGRVIYPINPPAAARYRARHAVSGANR
jgi:hypothetical protein